MATLREQLAQKRAHSTSLTFPLGEAGERARSDVEEAESAERLAGAVAKGDDADEVLKRAADRVKKAKRAYEKHSITISFRGLTDEEWDALISAHPPSEEQQQKEKDDDVPAEQRALVNKATFLPAALAVCALDSDLSEEDWAAELVSDRWTVGEKTALLNAVNTATHAQPGSGVGKGSGTIR